MDEVVTLRKVQHLWVILTSCPPEKKRAGMNGGGVCDVGSLRIDR